VLDALVSLGLSQTDAKVYIYLASKGPQDAENIAEALGTQEGRT
jgi:sugar-specific transcriptional regulator TrmB